MSVSGKYQMWTWEVVAKVEMLIGRFVEIFWSFFYCRVCAIEENDDKWQIYPNVLEVGHHRHCSYSVDWLGCRISLIPPPIPEEEWTKEYRGRYCRPRMLAPSCVCPVMSFCVSQFVLLFFLFFFFFFFDWLGGGFDMSKSITCSFLFDWFVGGFVYL